MVYDAYGNVTQSTTNNNGLETTTTNTLYGQFGTPIPAKPTTTTTTKTRSGQAAYSLTTTFGYNAIGQLTQKIDFAGLPQSVTIDYGYNNRGNLTTTTVTPSGMTARTTSATFDAKGRFALSASNVLGQSSSAIYDARWGKPLTTTGIDGLTTSYVYDAWGRTTQTTLPEGYAISQSWGWDLAYPATYYNLVQHPGKPDVKSWMDVLGREVKKQTEGFGGQWLTQTQTYDARGNVATSTQPYLSGETVLTTTTAYDAYNRVSSVNVTGAGTTNVGYGYAGGNLTVTTTNPAGQVSSKVTDASGQTISATDYGGTLSYVYNSQGNLLSVSSGAAVVASHQYDSYGRQTQLTDQNAGTTTYNYNAAGELTTQTNANGHTHSMSYDVMGRITTRTGPEGTTATEYYGAGSAAVNQLKKITGFAGNLSEYTYDGLGRLSTAKETIDNVAYTTTYGYNTYGDVVSKGFPSGFGTNHAYDANGYLTTIKNNTNTVTLFQAGTQNGLGQPLTYSLGNGKTSTTTYQYGMPTRYQTPGVQDLNLVWDYASGNLSSRQDAVKSKIESFTYDNLNRLKSATVGGLGGQSINYAPNGNLTSKTDAGTYSYLASKPNAVSAVTNTSFVIPGQEQLISYTAFLQPSVLTENGNELTYTYGADYERVKGVLKQNGVLQRTRYYVGAGYEKDLNAISGVSRELHYIDSPAGLIAIVVRENGTDAYHYVYTDHLGSILTVTNSAGTVEAEQNFDAWGRRRNATTWDYAGVVAPPDWLYRGYTGHEMLDPFVLINMNGRIYDPVLGRVLSPDNFVQDPFSTQNFNRYSYGMNNPLRYTDPDGNFFFVPFLAAAIQAAFFAGTSYAISAAITGQSLSGMGRAMLLAAATAGLSNLFPVGDIAGQYAAGLLPKGTPGFIKSLLAHGISSGLTGLLGAGIGGANVGQGFVQGAWQGVAVSALGQGIRGLQSVSKISTEDMLTVTLPEVRVKASRELTPKIYEFLSGWQQRLDHVAYVHQIADAAEWMVGLQVSTMLNAIPLGAVAGTATKSVGRVFWSGGEEAMNAAASYAKANGLTTLEMTRAGQNLTKLTQNMAWEQAGPMWQRLSSVYAKGAIGRVHVFQNATNGVRIGSVWRTVEYPILKGKNSLIFHNVFVP